jgi:hypothetical protein
MCLFIVDNSLLHMRAFTFRELFRRYRLRAEFSTLSSLSDALCAKGIIQDESLYSHWQRGSRVPHQRHLLLCLLEIFVERRAMSSLEEANEFLASAGMGYLTNEEMDRLRLRTIFQLVS